jgi:ELWxxDGT repeat protein
MRKLVPLLLLFLSPQLVAQVPYLVRDINTTLSLDTHSSSPAEYTSYRNRIFFVASSEATGRELWSADGNGATLVADVIPGSSGSSPSALRVVNGLLLFNAPDVDHGVELWATDGTAAGTRRVADINPGPSSSQPAARVVHGNAMLFSADDGLRGRELWITDGTAAGTRIVRDITAGAASGSPYALTAFGGSVYFGATGGLWKTDGTESGTVLVAPVSIRNPVAAGGRLFFEGLTAGSNWEPWVSDGTAAGTRLITEIIPGPKGSLSTNNIFGGTAFGDGILFVASDDVHGRELWFTDGSAAGTRMVRDLIPGSAGTWDQSLPSFVTLGGRAYFVATDAAHGNELWVTDGTEAGTALFADLTPGPAPSFAGSLTASNDRFYFRAAGRLWVSDGTVAGTRILGEATGVSSEAGSIVPVDGRIYFSGSSPLHGTEPWVTDGTEEGTVMVANVAPDGAPSASPRSLTATGSLLFFHAIEGLDARSPEGSLWRSDGTAAGTYKLRDAESHSTPLIPAGPFVFFKDSTHDHSFVMSDGTIEGTKSADAFMARFGEGEVMSLFPFGDTLFAAFEPSGGIRASLWKTTAAPDAPAVDLGPLEPHEPVEVAGRYMFFANKTLFHDKSLWTTDGTVAGTYAIVPDLKEDEISPLVNAGGTIYFLKMLRDEKVKLWRSDGTLDGTTVVSEAGDLPIFRASITAAGRRVFFVANNFNGPDQLWTSDGTAAGTLAIATTEISLFSSDPLVPIGDRIVFAKYQESGVSELWVSDGTAAGTKLLVPLTENYPELKNVEGLVYFAGVDEAHGIEPWMTDGTAEGTRMLFDLNPGPASSHPTEFTKLGNAIYFSAYTNATGRELWALPMTDTRMSIGDARAVEGGVVRFNVSIDPAPAQNVTVHYATADDTARAGVDYEATSGTLTFSAGQTTRSIDVRVLGDTAPENNETFFLQLNDAAGARLLDAEATGIVDDDDQAADLSVALSMTPDSSDIRTSLNVSNLGPRSATDIAVQITATPTNLFGGCFQCDIPQLAVGESVVAEPPSVSTSQTYLSAIVTARQADPQTLNNRTAWTVNRSGNMVMDAAYLTPGATATVMARIFTAAGVPSSSDPSVVAVSASTRIGENAVRFTVTALKAGTSVVNVDEGFIPLLVTVVAAGTTPRWPGGVAIESDLRATTFDRPINVTINPSGVAPLTGATATGTVTITAAGQELARQTLTGTKLTFPLYLRSLGFSYPVQFAYSGDANFAPQTIELPVTVQKGRVAITGTLVRIADGTYTLTLQVAGSPVTPPGGFVFVMKGAIELARLPLQPSTGGMSTAQVTITNLQDLATLTLDYYGDALYENATQQIRVLGARRRTVRHP